METKIMTYDEVYKLTNGYLYEYIQSTYEMLGQDYYEIYIKNYLESLEEIFKDGGLEIYTAEIETDYYGQEVSDVKIYLYMIRNNEFYEKHDLYCGEIEKCTVLDSGRGIEPNFPSEFYAIEDYNKVYYSLSSETIEFETEENLYEYYIDTSSDSVALVEYIDKFKPDSMDEVYGLDQLYKELTDIIKNADDYTFVNYNEDELIDLITSTLSKYKTKFSSNLINGLLDIDGNFGETDINIAKNELMKKLTHFYYNNADDYADYISETHTETLTEIFRDFCRRHDIALPISVEEYTEEYLRDYKYKVTLDDDGEVVDVEVCYDDYDCN